MSMFLSILQSDILGHFCQPRRNSNNIHCLLDILTNSPGPAAKPDKFLYTSLGTNTVAKLEESIESLESPVSTFPFHSKPFPAFPRDSHPLFSVHYRGD